MQRYVLPNLPAMNFVIDDALEGGVNFSLSLDGHGKSLSFLLLGDITVRVPVECVPVRCRELRQQPTLKAQSTRENAEKAKARMRA